MRRTTLAVAVLLTLSAALLARERPGPQPAPPAATEAGISVYFSPEGGCTAAIVEQIHAAKVSIDVQAYTLTSTAIAEALGQVQARGVKVRAVLDQKEAGDKYSGAAYLANHGVSVWLDGQHPIAHNKVMIIDGATVITGSFNFTRQAEEKNAENLLVITGKPKLAAAYEANFAAHLEHSQGYAAPR